MHDGLALCVFATGRYRDFLEGVIGTARRYLNAGCPLSIVTFTDTPPSPSLADIRFRVPHLPWPKGTLYRYRWIADHRHVLQRFPWIFMCDADMEFVAPVGPEILGSLVATVHGGHVGNPRHELPYERDPRSTAFVPQIQGKRYYAGGFQGGVSWFYLHACAKMAADIESDERRGITAAWHDESHWNAYHGMHDPEIALPPEYCWGEPAGPNPNVKILALDKHHASYRSDQSDPAPTRVTNSRKPPYHICPATLPLSSTSSGRPETSAIEPSRRLPTLKPKRASIACCASCCRRTRSSTWTSGPRSRSSARIRGSSTARAATAC